jgi:hypothetical protein
MWVTLLALCYEMSCLQELENIGCNVFWTCGARVERGVQRGADTLRDRPTFNMCSDLNKRWRNVPAERGQLGRIYENRFQEFSLSSNCNDMFGNYKNRTDYFK